ncbi:hypothetical protein [Alistipes timonensis]|uniref:hypothetical protein n=1 Tax=Alistipes timonensis TaxID=1465754 RepID=UPI001C3E01E5|nr:hypothetical protein [Alistipes timonensis]MCR2029424.1 hypothetical protein [Alistipes timonensis]
MKKIILSALILILSSAPAWADLSDRGRLSDIPGYHGGGYGWIIVILVIVLATIFNKDEK